MDEVERAKVRFSRGAFRKGVAAVLSFAYLRRLVAMLFERGRE